VGFKGSNIVLGKLSGRHAFKTKLKSLGFNLKSQALEDAFTRFKGLADKKQKIYDDDLVMIVEQGMESIPGEYEVLDFKVTSGNKIEPEASIILKKGSRQIEARSSGDGPIDACFKTIDKAIGKTGRLIDYKVNSVTGGKDALGEASVKVLFDKVEVYGRASSTDIIEASVLAYVNAVNRLSHKR